MTLETKLDYIFEGIRRALWLILSLDGETFDVILVSLKVSFAATLIACLVGVPLGLIIGVRNFWGKRAVVTVLNTLMALPTVVIGLTIYALISRRGPLGSLGLLYTPTAIVIGGFILATPIITALSLSAAQGIDIRVRPTALTLGASEFQATLAVLSEAKFSLLAAVVAGFGRVIADVGSAMMLGGNIRGSTRTMTTAIALETSKGEFGFGIALGIVLLFVAFSLNILFHYYQSKGT